MSTLHSTRARMQRTRVACTFLLTEWRCNVCTDAHFFTLASWRPPCVVVAQQEPARHQVDEPVRFSSQPTRPKALPTPTRSLLPPAHVAQNPPVRAEQHVQFQTLGPRALRTTHRRQPEEDRGRGSNDLRCALDIGCSNLAHVPEFAHFQLCSPELRLCASSGGAGSSSDERGSSRDALSGNSSGKHLTVRLVPRPRGSNAHAR